MPAIAGICFIIIAINTSLKHMKRAGVIPYAFVKMQIRGPCQLNYGVHFSSYI